MPETREVDFSHGELVQLMLEKQGITDGYWSINLRFTMSAGNLGGPHPRGAQVAPGVVITVDHIGIVKVEQPLPGLTIDASTGKIFDGALSD